MLLIEFETGAQGTIQVSGVAHTGDRGQEQHITLHGESGTLEADLTSAGAEIGDARHDNKPLETLSIPDRLWANADRTGS